jgi:small subunit ribosomal protein S2
MAANSAPQQAEGGGGKNERKENAPMAVVPMKLLLETGVHFGHRTRRWNPKMKSYIFTERNGVHIIDLQKTMLALEEGCTLVRNAVGEGGMLLFVGTKRQAQDTIEQEAQRCNMPYVNQRWLGGTLTNWRTIRQRIDYLLNLEARRDQGEFERLTKREALGLQRQIEKLNNRLGGIKQMRELPDMLYVVDVRREATAVKESNILDIPTIAIVDTNCDPDPIDYVIPANDDAIRAIRLITSLLAEAVLEGLALRKAHEPEQAEMEVLTEEDKKYLSPATLARLRELRFEEEEQEKAQITEGAEEAEVEKAIPEKEPEPEKVEAEAEEKPKPKKAKPEKAEPEKEPEPEKKVEAEAEEKPKPKKAKPEKAEPEKKPAPKKTRAKKETKSAKKSASKKTGRKKKSTSQKSGSE